MSVDDVGGCFDSVFEKQMRSKVAQVDSSEIAPNALSVQNDTFLSGTGRNELKLS